MVHRFHTCADRKRGAREGVGCKLGCCFDVNDCCSQLESEEGGFESSIDTSIAAEDDEEEEEDDAEEEEDDAEEGLAGSPLAVVWWTIQGWRKTSSRGKRAAGSCTSNLAMRSRAPEETCEGNERSTVVMRRKVALSPSASNGAPPVRNSYANTPNDQISTLESCGFLSTISGGR